MGMGTGFDRLEERLGIEKGISDEGWPCQRLRLANGLLLFFAFEVLIGKQLPTPMAYMLLGLGLASLVSAIIAIRSWKLDAQINLIKQALDA